MKITKILNTPYGGYQQWVEVTGYNPSGYVFLDEYIYHLHPPIPASEKASEALGCALGTRICGIRWRELSTTRNKLDYP